VGNYNKYFRPESLTSCSHVMEYRILQGFHYMTLRKLWSSLRRPALTGMFAASKFAVP